MLNQPQKNRFQSFTFLLCCLFLSSNINATTATWLGGIADWFDAGNWDTGVVPNFGDEIIIPSGEVIVPISNAKCRNVHISAGAALTIEGPGNLYIENDLSNASGIINMGTLLNLGGLYMVNVTDADTGIENHGEFTNKGILEIIAFDDYGIENLSGGIVVLSGNNSILNIGWNAVENHGTFSNNGATIIDSPGHDGINNDLAASFTNSGTIDITQIVFSGHAILNKGSYVNNSKGTINISNTTTLAAVLSIAHSSALFNNKGDIYISDLNGGGSAAVLIVDGTFINDRNAWLDIYDVSFTGISVYANGLFKNKSRVNINNASSSSINVIGQFINHQRGSTFIWYSGGHGIFTQTGGEYKNFGNTTIYYSTDHAIQNQGQFNNKPKGYFFTEGKINCTNGSSMLNQGHFTTDYAGNHSNIGGTITNNGSLGDAPESFNGTFNNQSVRVIPLSGNVQVNVPVANALDLGTLNYVTVGSWTTDQTGATSAGTYDAINNTFTPNANALGLTNLYVTIHINTGGNGKRYRIDVPGGVQPFSSGGGSSTMQTNGNKANEVSLLRKEDSTIANKFNIYPNPAQDVLFVETTALPEVSSELTLLNSLGQIVLQQTISSGNSKNNLTIPGNLSNGTYLLSIRQNGIPGHFERVSIVR